jgi:uncharacterized membrane protein
LPHRTLGWIWAGLMAFVAGSSFWDPRDPAVGSVELPSIFTPIMLMVAVVAARRHRVRTHRTR